MRGATELDTKHEEEMAYFNPRSSCEERRDVADRTKAVNEFQSTILMRGATIDGRDLVDLGDVISIHAPHARSDLDAEYIEEDE